MCRPEFKRQKLLTEEVLFNSLLINHEVCLMYLVQSLYSQCKHLLFFPKKIYLTKEKSSDRKRLAMIINNVEFRVRQFNRGGAEKDEESMRTLLKALGYDVIILNDLSAEVCVYDRNI